jgi:hypothetical protein
MKSLLTNILISEVSYNPLYETFVEGFKVHVLFRGHPAIDACVFGGLVQLHLIKQLRKRVCGFFLFSG